jgi:RNA polymerase sigma factor (sigma-70 family)
MQSQLPVHDPHMAAAIPNDQSANKPTEIRVVPDPEPSVDLTVVHIDPVHIDPRRDFETFYRESYANIARALTVTLGNLDLAQEATDEAMVRAYVRWEKIRSYDNPGGWVYRVGLNWARSARRRLSRAMPFHERSVVDATVIDPANYAALRDLDVALRSVVVCRLLLDWSVEETAAALRIKPGTVKSRLHRALSQLEQTLGEAS